MTRKSKAPSLEETKAPQVIEETAKGDNIENKDNKDRDPGNRTGVK